VWNKNFQQSVAVAERRLLKGSGFEVWAGKLAEIPLRAEADLNSHRKISARAVFEIQATFSARMPVIELMSADVNSMTSNGSQKCSTGSGSPAGPLRAGRRENTTRCHRP
jgi:hypothetical protein